MKHFWKRLHTFLTQRLYTNETIIIFQHDTIQPIESSAVIKKADQANLKDVLNFQNERYLATFRKFLQQGDIGYLAYLEQKCVHRSWVKSSPQKVSLHPLLTIDLEPENIWIHYCETAPNARGNNVYPYVLSKIANDFQAANKILISINEKNIASIKGVKKAGFKEYKRYKLLIICGIKSVKVIKKDG